MEKRKNLFQIGGLKPVYEDINITAHLDFYHFYKPNFSELFFLVEMSARTATTGFRNN